MKHNNNTNQNHLPLWLAHACRGSGELFLRVSRWPRRFISEAKLPSGRNLGNKSQTKSSYKKQTITFTAILLTLGCFAFLSQMQAVTPPPDGCHPAFTTAEGCGALNSLTTGAGNTAVGWRSLFLNTTGNFNTGVGAGALILNTGSSNTAVGTVALLLNPTGSNNTAVGTDALVNNSTGDYITAIGANAGMDPGIVSNNIYIGDPGFPGDTNVISIGGIAASGTPYELTFIGGIYGGEVNTNTTLPVYVDTDGHLGTPASSMLLGKM